jgi:hypothetical protein
MFSKESLKNIFYAPCTFKPKQSLKAKLPNTVNAYSYLTAILSYVVTFLALPTNMIPSKNPAYIKENKCIKSMCQPCLKCKMPRSTLIGDLKMRSVFLANKKHPVSSKFKLEMFSCLAKSVLAFEGLIWTVKSHCT